MQRVLIIRFSSIGDIVLCSPVLRNLKRKHPNIEIDIITKTSFKGLWQANPNVSDVYGLEDQDQTWRKKSYDLIIDLHKNLRSFRIKCIRWDVPSITFNKGNVRKALLVLTKSRYFGVDSITNRYADLLKKLGIEVDNHGLEFYGEEEVPSECNIPSSYIACVLGGSFATKQVPLSKWVDFLSEYQGNQPFVLLGAKSENEIAQALVKQFPEKVIDTTGLLTIFQSAYLVKHAQIVVSGDTGLGHIAAAFGRNIIWIWGNTTPEIGMLPPIKPNAGNQIEMQIEGLKCRPCSKLGYRVCPKLHFKCMDHSPKVWAENLEKLKGSTLG